MMHLLLLVAGLAGGPERENHRGIEAWSRRDTATALRQFAKAAQLDSTQSDYAFNSGTLKALAGKDADPDLTAAIARARTPDEKARALYNRGTARLAKAAGAPPGQGDVSGAISDLRDAVRMRPGWSDASRNLDRALRMRPPPQPKKDPKPDDKQDRKDPKDDRKDAPPKDDGEKQQPQPPQPSPGMDPQDAQRLLDGAAAREAQQQREQRRKPPEDNDGPDW